MRVAVIGGTGTAGAYAVAALRDDGHTVQVVSRRTGVDVYTGEGLEAALAGVDVVVDTLNTRSTRRSVAEDFFATAANRLQAAATAQRVRHVVLLTILGADRVRGFGYYLAKVAHEQATVTGGVPTTVLRATQFHEFAGQLLDRSHGRWALVPHLRCQPVAARTVGEHLARAVADQPGDVIELAGPQEHDILELARQVAATRGARTRVLAVPVPGRAGRDIRRGALLATSATLIDGPTFAEWLGSADATGSPAPRVAAPSSTSDGTAT